MRMRPSHIIIVFLLMTGLVALPTVVAQKTSITDLHYPAGIKADSTEPISVTATISYQNAAPSYLLAVGIVDMTAAQQSIVPGIATSSPDQCGFQPSLAAFCLTAPRNSSGAEHVQFKIGGILGSPLLQTSWKLNMTAVLLTSNRTIVENSASSVLFTIVVSPMILTVKVPSTIAVTIDGTQQSPGPIELPVSPGVHVISVPSKVQVDSATRLRFDGWTDGFGLPNRTVTIEMSRTFEAVYVTQYLLTIAGQGVSATGQGWYDAGSTATITVSQTEPMAGILGLLGGKLRFQGWLESKQLLAESPMSKIVMDKPHTLTIAWQADYILPMIISAVAIIILGLAYLAVHRRNVARSRIRERTQPRTKQTKKRQAGRMWSER